MYQCVMCGVLDYNEPYGTKHMVCSKGCSIAWGRELGILLKRGTYKENFSGPIFSLHHWALPVEKELDAVDYILHQEGRYE